MKIIAAILIIFSVTNIYACEIEVYKYIYKVSNDLDAKIIKSSNCQKEVNDKVIAFMKGLNGKASNRIIQEQLDLVDFELNPRVIHIENLADMINTQFELGESKSISELKFLTNISQIQSDKAHDFKFECESCFNKLGNTNIKILNSNKIFWLKAKVLKKSIAWVAKDRVNTFNRELNPNLFEQKVVYLDKEIDTFQDITKIRFFQTTRALSQGEMLTQNHLSPIQLVRAFSKVRLIVEGSTLNLTTSAKAKRGGYLNEFIEVTNLKSNKKFLAKITDFNTVEIQL